MTKRRRESRATKKIKEKWARLLKAEQAKITLGAGDVRPFRMVNISWHKEIRNSKDIFCSDKKEITCNPKKGSSLWLPG